ncbi:MAG TPA: hypothetical protein VMG40_15365 [Bryobacteraceae bacterium]|nr:hypothetical protein [Bryobacteraceae bacterium]
MSKFIVLSVFAVTAVWGQQSNPCGSQPTSGGSSACINPTPTRQYGQPSLPLSLYSIAPNLVEGRELNQPYSVAFDNSVSPPILYIVDTSNNRVLAYQNPYNLNNCGLNNPTCGFATLAIGPNPKDFVTTLTGGPGRPENNTGLDVPTAAVVDANGNLYVLDAGNNRILRYPAPFKQTSSTWQVDLVIGQVSFNSGVSPNQGMPAPTAQTLYFSSGNTVYNASMAIEPSTGALWVTDPGNNRTLRFPSSQLTAGNNPTADLVVGQATFTSGSALTPPTNTDPRLNVRALYQPLGIAFDSKGRLYISDGQQNNFYRVMVYVPGFGIEMSATWILGLVFQLSNQTQAITFPNNYSLIQPIGLFTTGENLWVCDAGDNRVVEYDIPENWPPLVQPISGQPLTSQISPPIMAVLGQNDLQSGKSNKAQAAPDNSTVSAPFGGAVNGTDIWVADTLNNRVLDFPQQSGGKYTTAARVVGQLDFPYNSANLIEGREVNFASGFGGGGVAVDHSSNPPHLYIADTANNRILCFNSVYTIGKSSAAQADMVIGQNGPLDYYESLFNYPTNDSTKMTSAGLNRPTDVLVDPGGNLWVADFGNSRVLRYPPPFLQPSGTTLQPDLVLGQFGFTGTPDTAASSQTMAGPYGLTMFSDGSLAVSDALLNRVLIFTKPSGGDFTNSQSAAVVLGQQSFTASATSNSNSGLNSPRHLSVDSSDRLYVADATNNRIVVWDGTQARNSGSDFSLQLANFSNPQAVKVSGNSGEVWVANTNGDVLYRLPEYDTLIATSTPTSYPITARINTQTGPLAVDLDDNDNVVIAEAANRVTFYYAALAAENAASYNLQPLAPGQLELLYRYGLNFGFNSAQQYPPLQTVLNDIQVLANGEAAPIYELGGGAYSFIAFQVPSDMPTSGTVSIVVQHQSTGQIIGSMQAQMAPFNPGFFTSNATGTGPAAATNWDGSINSASNPVKAGGTHGNGTPNFITFYLTGGGPFPGLPDGTVATGAINTTVTPQILSADGCLGLCPSSDLIYSGASFFPGVWQINFIVDKTFPPGQHAVVVTMQGDPSNIGASGQANSVQVSFFSN